MTKTRKLNKTGGATKKNKKTGLRHLPKLDLNFKPNLTPREIFTLGSFGGTYWRPIKSKFFTHELKNAHKKYPGSWWKGIPDDHLTRKFDKYDTKINKYGVKVGTTLEFWDDKNWTRKSHPYGWVQWYCDYYMGKRGQDDERQIKRWQSITGPNGRFRKFLITQIVKKGGKWNDEHISPKIRQVLQHWGYKLTKRDFDREIRDRKKSRKGGSRETDRKFQEEKHRKTLKKQQDNKDKRLYLPPTTRGIPNTAYITYVSNQDRQSKFNQDLEDVDDKTGGIWFG